MKENRISCDLGVIGLSSAGKKLILNLNDHGSELVLFSRSAEVSRSFLKLEAADRSDLSAAASLDEFILRIRKPRRVLLIPESKDLVDYYINQLLPLLEKGDVIIDGSSPTPADTEKRASYLAEMGVLFAGVSCSRISEGFEPPLADGSHPEALTLIRELLNRSSC